MPLLFCFAVLFPLSLLFYGGTTGFTSDWYNSIWMIGYQRYGLLANYSFSPVFNTSDLIGNSQPLFYGYILYPVLGLLSVPFGPHLTLRAVVIAVCSLEFFLVYQTVRTACASLRENKAIAFAVAVLFTWSIYPLTNLYTRSALPEFFGGKFLVCALCTLYGMIQAKDLDRKKLWAWGFAVSLSFCLGTHPITAFLGSYMVGILFFSMKKEKTDWIFFMVAGAVAVVVLSPWLVALAYFSKDLSIAHSLGEPSLHGGIDEWWIRLFPLPLDMRAIFGGTSIPTPYLDAQINLPLLILSLGLAVWTKKHTKKAFWGIFSLFCFVFFVSIGWIPTSVARSILGKIQILYRWSAFQNIILLFLVVYLVTDLQLSEKTKGALRTLFTVLLTVSFCGVLLRLVHAAPITLEGAKFGYSKLLQEEDFRKIPTSFYSIGDYLVRKGYEPYDGRKERPLQNVKFEVGTGSHFGEVYPIFLDKKSPAGYCTQVLVFPWNQLKVDGVIVPSDQIRLASDKVAFYDEGEGKRVEYVFAPPLSWKIARTASFLTLFLLLTVVPLSFFSLKKYRVAYAR